MWGLNTRGELGLGDTAPRSVPYPYSSLKDKISELVACDGFTIALSRSLTSLEKEPIKVGSYVKT